MRKVIFSKLGPRLTSRIIAVITALAICIGGYKFLGTYYSQKNANPNIPPEQIPSGGVQAENTSNGENGDNGANPPNALYSDENAVIMGNTISSASALLCNHTSNTVICKKSTETPVPATAILSLSVALTVADSIAKGEVSPSERAVCPAAACKLPYYEYATNILSVGQSLTVAELVKCLFCAPPEIFAYTLAIHIGGSESVFVEKMNHLLKNICSAQTQFNSLCEVSTLTTTALDAVKIFRAATETPVLLSILSSKASFTVSAGGTAWDTVTLCNKFYSDCCTEGQAKADGIICGYYFESEGKQFAYVLFERLDTKYSAVAMSSDTAYADTLIMLSKA